MERGRRRREREEVRVRKEGERVKGEHYGCISGSYAVRELAMHSLQAQHSSSIMLSEAINSTTMK